MDELARKVLVTGAGGFVGGYVVGELLARGFGVWALVRRERGIFAGREGVREVVGDVGDEESLRRAMGAAGELFGVIHLVGIIEEKRGVTFEGVHVEGTRHVLAAAKEAGVGRYVHMSALGTRAGAASNYHRTKWAGEELVRGSGLEWTIFRPSLIHGAEGEFMRMVRGWSLGKRAPWFFMPYFGEGFWGQRNLHRIAPVYVGDVAKVFVGALEKREAVGRVYDVAGPGSFTWPEFLRVASRIFRGREKVAVGVPVWWAKVLAGTGLPVGFNWDQVVMSQEENVGDVRGLRGDFGEVELRGFEEMVERYKGEMGNDE